MADDDEYDALLEEPLGEDVDWTAIDVMTASAGLNLPTAGAQASAQSTSESDEYFNDDEVLDESFLDEVRRLEGQVIAATPATDAPVILSPATHSRRIHLMAARDPVASPAGSSRPLQPNWGLSSPNTGETSLAASASSENTLPGVERLGMVLEPRSPQSTLSAARNNSPLSDFPLPSWVPADDQAQIGFFLDPPLPASTSTSRASTSVDLPPITRLSSPTPSTISCQASSTRKRRSSSGCWSDAVPPSRNAQGNAKKKAKKKTSKFMEVIEKTLECPICFDTIAASHVFACGHSACGLCLCEWIRIKGDNTTCCVCRAPHKGPLLPNYTLDGVAASYFHEKSKSGQDGLDEVDYNERKRWEKRNIEGKAAVQAAARKKVKSLTTVPTHMGSMLHYDPDEENALENDGLYEDAYDDYDIYDILDFL